MGIYIKPIPAAPLENLSVGRKHLRRSRKSVIRKHIQPTRSDDSRIEHPQRSRGRIPCIRKRLLALHFQFGINPCKLRPRQKHLAANLSMNRSIDL